MTLFSEYKKGSLHLKNRVVMAPMTRSRSDADHVPTDIMIKYYAQRANAGLLITEGTSPSINGAGYARIPGIYNEAQVEAWKKVTDAVHEAGGKIFVQLMHSGRVTHPENLSAGGQIVAPSPIRLEDTKMYVDGKGELDIPVPTEMSIDDIAVAIEEYAAASKMAIRAGFDGVELHAANGYLIEQFISPTSNNRTDSYGGSVENRSRFALEVTRVVVAAIGKEHVGIRLSPYGVMNEVGFDKEVDETFNYLAKHLNEIGITYIHLLDHSPMGAPDVPQSIKKSIREKFDGTIILCGGYDKEKAERDLEADLGDAIAFGRPYIANPDLVLRMKHDEELNDPNPDTFYTPGAEGYIDYPILEHHKEKVAMA
ncbi:MAG: alkene reductase [Bacteroidota bacterium]